jgi:hypothetical protein
MDDSKRIVIVEGYGFDDSTPAIKSNLDDHLGSSNVTVDDTGALVSFEEYYLFGETSLALMVKALPFLWQRKLYLIKFKNG